MVSHVLRSFLQERPLRHRRESLLLSSNGLERDRIQRTIIAARPSENLDRRRGPLGTTPAPNTLGYGMTNMLSAPGINGDRVPMRDLSREEVDVCIVGAGASGCVVGARLAEAGFSVVILDAGPHWDPTR